MAPQISKRSLNIYFSSIYLIYKNKIKKNSHAITQHTKKVIFMLKL